MRNAVLTIVAVLSCTLFTSITHADDGMKMPSSMESSSTGIWIAALRHMGRDRCHREDVGRHSRRTHLPEPTHAIRAGHGTARAQLPHGHQRRTGHLHRLRNDGLGCQERHARRQLLRLRHGQALQRQLRPQGHDGRHHPLGIHRGVPGQDRRTSNPSRTPERTPAATPCSRGADGTRGQPGGPGQSRRRPHEDHQAGGHMGHASSRRPDRAPPSPGWPTSGCSSRSRSTWASPTRAWISI